MALACSEGLIIGAAKSSKTSIVFLKEKICYKMVCLTLHLYKSIVRNPVGKFRIYEVEKATSRKRAWYLKRLRLESLKTRVFFSIYF